MNGIASTFSRFLSAIRNLRWRTRVDQDIDDEVRSHLQLLIDEKTKSGATIAEARRAAMLELGGVEQVKEQIRVSRAGARMESVFRDGRYAIRSLRHAPRFTLSVIGTLAIGIGANTAVFTVVDELLFRPPLYPHGDRLVHVISIARQGGTGGGNGLNAHRLLTWQSHQVFDQLEAFAPTQLDVGGEDPERINGFFATPGFFSLLGGKAEIGRTFGDGDGKPNSERVVVLSNAIWRRQFNSSPDAVGRTIALDDEAYRIVGVMPRSFHGPPPSWALSAWSDDDTCWIPFDPSAHNGDSTVEGFLGVGRLHDGMSIKTAQQRSDTLASAMNQSDPQPRSWYLYFSKLKRTYASESARTAMLVLLSSVALVLLIACANVGNLLMVRSGVRQREMLVRAALGGSRARLIGQALTESGILALTGGACGIALAWIGIRVVHLVAPPEPILLDTSGVDIGIDARVLVFTAALTSLTAILVGLWPAIRATSANPGQVSRAALSGGRAASPVTGTLITCAVALSFVLLVSAGLMTQTFAKLIALEPGFDPHDVVAVQLALRGDRYPTPLSRSQFLDAALARISALPGVSAAAAADDFPPILMSQGTSKGIIEGDDGVFASQSAEQSVSVIITQDYLRTLGIPLIIGRSFTASEPDDSVIINQSLAHQLWPDGSAIGHRLRAYDSAPWKTVVGVVGDIEVRMGDERLAAQMYHPMEGGPAPPRIGPARPLGRRFSVSRWLIVKARDTQAIARALKNELRGLDQAVAVKRVEFVDNQWANMFAPQRFALQLMGLFALLAVALAASGLFASIAYAVTERTPEIGIQMALGARQHNVLIPLLRRGTIVTMSGIVVGFVIAVYTTRYLRVLLFGVGPLDAATFAAVAIVFISIAMLAMWLPARRATRVDPLIALRAL